MSSPGEEFAQRLNVEAPDFCTKNCAGFGSFLLELTNMVNSGEVDPTFAEEPLTHLMRTCPTAVAAGGLSEGTAMAARTQLLSLDSRRADQPDPPCVIDTFTASHALMYALGQDPYFGWMDE